MKRAKISGRWSRSSTPVLDVAPDTEWPPKAEAHGATLRYLASAMLPWLLEGDWSTAPEAGDG